MILYLHGFRSGPQSVKAQQLGAYCAAQGVAFVCPQLPPDPAAAMELAEELIAGARARGESVTLVGSSLGGFFATALAERHQLKAALINPAVIAHLSLADYLGPQTYLYSGETFVLTPQHLAALRALEVPAPTPARYLLLAEKGDELLDWRQAAARYAGCRQVILDGGDHSFTRFADYLPTIVEFAGAAGHADAVPGAGAGGQI